MSSVSVVCYYARSRLRSFFFFFNDTATTEIYTLSLHDALPISPGPGLHACRWCPKPPGTALHGPLHPHANVRPVCRSFLSSRSEEHTSELQSQSNLVCRLLLEKKKIIPLESIDNPPTREGNSGT